MTSISTVTERGLALSRHVARKARELGPFGMPRFIAERIWRTVRGGRCAKLAATDLFDATYGTETAAIVPVWALGISHARSVHANRYQTVAPEVFLESLHRLEIRYEDYVFVDLGSGKGRALLLASRYPFKEIIGVEISSRLHEAARKNVEVFARVANSGFNITTVCGDVTDFQFPQENLVLYLYNPFDEDVMEAVVANVEQFVRTTSRHVLVVYHYPDCRKVWDRVWCFRPLEERERFVIYTTFRS